MDLADVLRDAADQLREYAVYVAADRDNAKKRGDAQWADHLQRQWRHTHEVADFLLSSDPQTVPAKHVAIAEIQALAAELAYQLGRLTPDRRALAPVSVAWRRIKPMSAQRVVAYLRVSTDAQADDGFGLEVQEAAVQSWARNAKARIVFVCTDAGKSGAANVIDRPGLAEALGHVQAGRADAIVVARLDRLARDLVLTEWVRAEIIDHGAQLRSASSHEDLYLNEDPDDPTGTLVRQILGAVAQYERSMIRLRMEAGKAHKLRAGGYAHGAPPYGFRAADGELVTDLEEKRAIGEMKKLRKSGLSYAQIAARLNETGVPARRGRWHPQTVSRVIQRAS